MEDEEGKVENSTEVSDDAAAQNDRIADLNSQIDELKRELDAVKKKLHRVEFERNSAQRNADNLKSEVKELSKKLQEERKKSAESRKRNSDALRTDEKNRGKLISGFVCFSATVDTSVCLSAWPSMQNYAYLCIPLSFPPPAHLLVYQPTYMDKQLCVHLSDCLFICLSV